MARKAQSSQRQSGNLKTQASEHVSVILALVSLISVLCRPVGDGEPWSLSCPPQTEIQNEINDPTARQKSDRSEQKILIGTDLVSLTVTVRDHLGRFVSGLKKEHFVVSDDDVEQQIAHFSDEDTPLSVGIVFDVSHSMKDRMGHSLRALKRFVETSHPDDDFFLVAFNDKPVLVQDFTTSGDRIVDGLRSVAPRGSTALYDAVYLGVEKVQQGRHPRRAILIISDGEDNKSRYNGEELRARVTEADVQIYAVSLTDALSNDSLSSKYGRSVLEKITSMTGGRAFFPNAYNEELLIEICARIALELRRQYSLAFYPSNTGLDGRWHKVRMKLKPPKGLGLLSLTYREGYQALKR
jgi:Ca-activated chloride channel family protein